MQIFGNKINLSSLNFYLFPVSMVYTLLLLIAIVMFSASYVCFNNVKGSVSIAHDVAAI